MIDPVAAMRAFLLSDTAIAAAVGGRVYGAPPGLPEGTTSPPPASLVIQMAGGSVAPNIPVIDPRLYLRAYGPDARAAASVLSLVYNALYTTAGQLICNRMIGNRWFLYWCQIEALSAPAIETESLWPVALATLHARFDSLRGA